MIYKKRNQKPKKLCLFKFPRCFKNPPYMDKETYERMKMKFIEEHKQWEKDIIEIDRK